MQRIHTTKTEQALLSILLITCCVLVMSALLVLLHPAVPSVQLVHAAGAHLAGVAAAATATVG